MPTRYLYESICTSASIDALTPGAEVLWYRLLTKLDDFGRFHADPTLVLAACFPRKIGRTKPRQVRGWIAELVDNGMVRLYAAHGDVYMVAAGWETRQRTRASSSKFPDPPSDGDDGRHLLTDDGQPPADGGQAQADAHGIRSSVFDVRSSVVRGSRATPPSAASRRPADPPEEIPPEAEHLFAKYLGKLKADSPRVFAPIEMAELAEIATDEGLDLLAASRMLSDVWDWWRTAPPSKRWKKATRGWRNWLRREAARIAEKAAEPTNGQAQPARKPAPPPEPEPAGPFASDEERAEILGSWRQRKQAAAKAAPA